MEKYTGVKEIIAKPMNRKEYNDYRGWKLPSDENGKDEGFLVEYIESGTIQKVNHPKHKGYISWSPIDVFEDSYIKTDIDLNYKKDIFESHEQRVVSELRDLQVKAIDLRNFTKSDFFKEKIDVAEQERLNKQLIVMETYSSILIERINNFI